MSAGELPALVWRGVTERNAAVVVIDSLNGYLQAMPQERFLALEIHQLLSYLNQHRVLTILVMAQHGLVGVVESPIDLSYLSDAVLFLRFFEPHGKVRKPTSPLHNPPAPPKATIHHLP